MSTPTKNFLGIPIEGDILRRDARVAQRPLEELAPLLQAALDLEWVDSIRWRQYTPYFNDGDACEFGVQDVMFRLAGDHLNDDENDYDEVGEYEDGYHYYSDVAIKGGRQTRYDGAKRAYVETGIVFPEHDGYEHVKALCAAIGTGAFENVLLDAFGDHALVTIHKDKIIVDYYEHE